MCDAVREHLVSDVPLGVWASGGLDSSAVLHYAASQNATPLKTFSVSFAGRSFDESQYFREIARAYGTDHYEFDLNPEQELQSAIEDFAYYSDEPSADAGALPVWYLSRMSRRHVTVALSGDGADELFGGYLTYQADRFARPFRHVPSPLRRLMLGALDRYMPCSDDKISLEYKLKRWIEEAGSIPTRRISSGTAPFPTRSGSASGRGRKATGFACWWSASESNPPASSERYMRVDQNYYLPDDILYKCDRMSMAHSLEVRPPFLDHRIVEFAARLPQNLKIRGGKQKFLLRELMRGKLPAAILRARRSVSIFPPTTGSAAPCAPC